MVWGWAAALGAALCYGVASVAQAIGVHALAAVPAGVPARRRAWAGRWYAVGLALDSIGFAAAVVALQALPLFVVQAAVAASVGVTALTARVVLRTGLSRIQVSALVVLGAGLVALGASAPTQSARLLSPVAGWILVAAAGPLAVLVAVATTTSRRAGWTFPALAVSAGLGFAGVGIAARVLVIGHPWWSTLATPAVWGIVAYGVVSAIAFALALSRGSVTVATAWSLAVETVIPAVVGLVVLGDRILPGHGGWVAVGFAAVLAGCLALAGRAHPEPGVPEPESVTP